MPSIREQSTVEAIAQAFTGSEKRNKVRAMMAVGYTESYANSGRGQKVVYENVRVREAIKAIDEAKEAKEDYNYHLAMTALRGLLAQLAAMEQTPQVVRDKLAVCKEMNECTGLHKLISVDETGKQAQLDEKQRVEARRLTGLRLRQGASEPPGELN